MLEWMNVMIRDGWRAFCLGFSSGFKVEGGEVEIEIVEEFVEKGLKSRKLWAFQNSRNFHTMMRGGPLRVVATAGAAVTAGIFTLSMLSSVSLGAFQAVVENKRVQKFPWVILNLAMYLRGG